MPQALLFVFEVLQTYLQQLWLKTPEHLRFLSCTFLLQLCSPLAEDYSLLALYLASSKALHVFLVQDLCLQPTSCRQPNQQIGLYYPCWW